VKAWKMWGGTTKKTMCQDQKNGNMEVLGEWNNSMHEKVEK
jgi:hypothetical protein